MTTGNCGGVLEIWRVIPGFFGYEASSFGRIRSYWNNRHGMLKEPKILRPSIDSVGYFSFHPRKPEGGKGTLRVHVAVCLAFHGIPSKDAGEVCHADGTRTNNRPENLRWDSHRENLKDMLKHGTRKMKFSAEQVLQMRADHPALSMRAISKKYGVSHRTLQQIIKRERWAHI